MDDAALEERDLNVDFIGLSVKDRLGAESKARTEAWAYRRLRRAATSREDGFVSERETCENKGLRKGNVLEAIFCAFGLP